ncbi:HAD hydrolase-like protein [Streptomyces alkaliphilus]|uniref:HAD hydrolase-like protein n=1 Tax=Streptomyces alkaliphilus TaxID=1472722 RepID=A0A7W3TC00_9ACTN|nr:HAD hydrolase-like protein [Streptomyces alkaliphilus]MBB0244079.1 HAD hydrolase-like protein [Streptomyces alkaliphilus]
MKPQQELSELLSGVRTLLVDFDGPFCSVFAGLSAGEVAERMRRQLVDAGHDVRSDWKAEHDPLALLRRIADEAPGSVPDADRILAALETEAARLARPNPEMSAVLDAAVHASRDVIVVSNNAGSAIRCYLENHRLTHQVPKVVGRRSGEPESMKPSPRLLLDAMESGRDASEYVFIGDAVRDVEAGHAAGVHTIGYANKQRKEQALADAGAVVVMTSLFPIAEALATSTLRI